MWDQLLEGLRSSAPAYALVVGTLYFCVFWLIDHCTSYAMVMWLPAAQRAPLYRRNMLSVLRRMLLLCTAVLLMTLDYIPVIRPLLSPLLQQLPMTMWAPPLAACVVAIWLGIEVWIMRQLVMSDMLLRQWWLSLAQQNSHGLESNDRTPGVMDFVRLPAEPKQWLIGSEPYGQLSNRINRILYALTYVHLLVWFYGARS